MALVNLCFTHEKNKFPTIVLRGKRKDRSEEEAAVLAQSKKNKKDLEEKKKDLDDLNAWVEQLAVIQSLPVCHCARALSCTHTALSCFLPAPPCSLLPALRQNPVIYTKDQPVWAYHDKAGDDKMGWYPAQIAAVHYSNNAASMSASAQVRTAVKAKYDVYYVSRTFRDLEDLAEGFVFSMLRPRHASDFERVGVTKPADVSTDDLGASVDASGYGGGSG